MACGGRGARARFAQRQPPPLLWNHKHIHTLHARTTNHRTTDRSKGRSCELNKGLRLTEWKLSYFERLLVLRLQLRSELPLQFTAIGFRLWRLSCIGDMKYHCDSHKYHCDPPKFQAATVPGALRQSMLIDYLHSCLFP